MGRSPNSQHRAALHPHPSRPLCPKLLAQHVCLFCNTNDTKSMSPETLKPITRLLRTRMILPTLAVIIFQGMVAIAEHQVRSSPKWPPPPRHEAGGWQIEDPPLWTLAAGLNLPATVPILWMSAISDGFTYALDDHHLIIYLPWTFFVFWLWYFVAYHFDQSAKTQVWASAISVGVAFSAQALITAELIYCGIGIISRSPGDNPPKPPIVVVACFWAWVLATIIGWVSLIRRVGQRPSVTS